MTSSAKPTLPPPPTPAAITPYAQAVAVVLAARDAAVRQLVQQRLALAATHTPDELRAIDAALAILRYGTPL